jgi:hypothetical protein
MEPAWEKVTETKFGLSEYTDSTGRKLPCYELTKRECLYVATKFNDEARAKLVIRWEALEVDRLVNSGAEKKEAASIPDFTDAKTQRHLRGDLLRMLQQYLTAEDKTRIRRKFGISEQSVRDILNGRSSDNAVMQEMQRRAVINKDAEINAYAPERMQRVVEKLRVRS